MRALRKFVFFQLFFHFGAKFSWLKKHRYKIYQINPNLIKNQTALLNKWLIQIFLKFLKCKFPNIYLKNLHSLTFHLLCPKRTTSPQIPNFVKVTISNFNKNHSF